jgi:hypothetical protein
MAAVSGQVLLSDVAAAARVSLATASRALNGQAGVGAELAERSARWRETSVTCLISTLGSWPAGRRR